MDAVLDSLLDAVYDGTFTSDDLASVLAKAHGSAAPSNASPETRKKIAAGALAATGVAGVGGLHAMAGTRAEHKLRMAEAAEGKPARGLLRRVDPKKAALIATGGWAALHGVELAADAANAHAQSKEYRRANAEVKRTKVAAAAPRDGAFIKVGVAKRMLSGLQDTAQLGAHLAEKQRVAAQAARLDPNERLHVVRNGVKHYHDTNGVPFETRNAHRMRVAAQDQEYAKLDRKVTRYDAVQGAKAKVADTAAQAHSVATQVLSHPHVQAAMQAAHQVRTPPPKPTGLAALRAHPAATALAGGAVAGGGAVAYSNSRKNQYGLAKQLIPVEFADARDEHDLEWTGTISKVDADKRQVFGWCSLSKVDGAEVVDLQGDYIPIEETEASAYKYVIESRKGGDMHRRVSKFDGADQPLHTADLIESFVVTPEKLEKMGLPGDALPHGWWIGMKVNDDEQWSMVKKGMRAGFSIHGSGIRKDLVLDH